MIETELRHMYNVENMRRQGGGGEKSPKKS